MGIVDDFCGWYALRYVPSFIIDICPTLARAIPDLRKLGKPSMPIWSLSNVLHDYLYSIIAIGI